MDRWLTRNAPAIVLFAALLVAWQFAVSVFGIREYILPSPLVVLRALSGSEIPWAGHLWITTLEIVGAFVVAGAGRAAHGVESSVSPVPGTALGRFPGIFYTHPKMAMAAAVLLRPRSEYDP